MSHFIVAIISVIATFIAIKYIGKKNKSKTKDIGNEEVSNNLDDISNHFNKPKRD
jgi:hypothetical protein